MRLLTALLLLVVALGPLTAQEKSAASAREPGLYATLETSMGKIVVKLFDKEAPKTVANFVDLATGKKTWKDHATGREITGKPFFDGILFHRVIPDFMIQTGAHLPNGGARLAPQIADEFHPGLKHDRPGRLSMANAGPNTGSSQFFITHRPTPHLDGKHAVFGQVIEGQAIVVAIAAVPRGPNDVPRTPIFLKKVTIERIEAPAKQQ
ncbi:MAG: peptidylprolyl isomerase [Candidatus Acidiferrales bacterium]